jgi:pilus assembly protein CpaF
VLRRLLAARASIVVSGGTGTGKTTLVRALLRECEPTERVVIVEEIREIGDLGRGNFVSLVSREKNVEGAGEVSLSQLVTATLRMRPDRIVLGECRGPETADVLRAFNTGHRGGMVTIHSNGIERLPQRLVALGQLSGMSSESLVTLADGAFDVALHLERAARGPLAGSRRVSCIGHLCGDAPTGPLGVSEERGSHQRAKGLRGEVLSTWDGMGSPVIFPGWEEFSSQWGLEDDGGEVT